MTAPLEKLLHVFFTNKIHVISDVKLDETFDVWHETIYNKLVFKI